MLSSFPQTRQICSFSFFNWQYVYTNLSLHCGQAYIYIYGAPNVVWGHNVTDNTELKYIYMKKVEEKGILSIHLLNAFVPGLQISYYEQTICGLNSLKTPSLKWARLPSPPKQMEMGKQGSWVLGPNCILTLGKLPKLFEFGFLPL